MKDWQGKRYWLVGASDGLGAALAQKLSRAGAEVILSARSEDKLAALAASLPGKASYQAIDVADTESVKAAAAAVGAVDGVVFLAGVYWPFGAKEWDADQATAMADVNFTGLVRVMGQVVPAMVARDAGHIVITSSLTGFRGLPGSIGYTASKAGTMSLAECMYADLRKTGVQVQVVNPGFIKTQLTAKNDFKMPFLMEAEDAAQEMFEHMNTESFKKSFPWLFSWLFRASQVLPDWLYFRIFS
ncbi:SDR family NAD(P)-dependent oxidoreductase [Sulfitobacter sp. M57]|uniref:SDR family NAD(P)-dependent oxidoreductase n=1 Tax=unclassified Sulfitobacter TaxID=196795 RepID=UPI0023E0EC7C|nr:MULTISPECIES: SDR family NAD(P)-dependent oxidoreductase [unclassified Sulfitobacter]MDF3415407.1 SDR family NAD(P)-dependent oxidoreductase [Sulfitobacter sp. KE5]MDF3422888.1 SDR family NAD(P)-dependent oxidoreductase [Sulfitobacter sp. KE43]MDF3433953.1 SDR family NAD(P)-dependent oxidoreductase [Sulfitobacter sp. KE42]MDF3459593.1 SDR family NAD(P)-dependent oxidoreductase [Sulfitobacter sp. S74]MDF3463492.1 SDR family NAD(P)-dependent oxidoreductase [Sulfitobacter sp. Ks18]